MSMGFSREQARAALDRHGGDATRAVEALLSGGGTDDEALARKMQAAEYSGGGGPSGVGSSSAAEEIARALERQLNGGGGIRTKSVTSPGWKRVEFAGTRLRSSACPLR